MKFTVDRFEENFAVVELEDETVVTIPKNFLEENAREGDIYELTFLEEETQRRRASLKNRLSSLFSRKKD